MKYPALYVYRHTGDNGQELKHSIRSLKNITNWNGEVIVVGDREKWFKGITHIPCRKMSHSPYHDIELKIREALLSDKAPDNFIFMNDDIFCMEPMEAGALHSGEISLVGSGYHHSQKVKTREYLKSQGYTTLDYSTHTPMLMNKDKRLAVSDKVMSTIHGVSLKPRLLYGNMYCDGEYYKDCKTRTNEIPDRPIVSTSFYTEKLNELFPDASKFEDTFSVSVLMPTYNDADLVIKALDSIPKNVTEIIIVNDGSTDNTKELITEWAKHDKRAKVYNNRGNKGVGYTINRCYDLATSDYTVILSSDDYMHPTMKDVIEQLDGSDFVFFNLSYNIKGKKRVPSPRNYRSWAGSCKLVRREFMEGVRASNKLVNEDKELYEMLLKKPHTTKFTNIMGKHYNTPRLGSLTDRKQKGEFGQDLVTVGEEAFWRRYNEENRQ